MKNIEDELLNYQGPKQFKLNDDTHPISDWFADSE